MDHPQKKYIEALQRLVKTCENTRENYDHAAQRIKDDELQNLFNQYAEQRVYFASELKDHISNLGGSPENPENNKPLKALNQLWSNLRSSFTNPKDDEKSILQTIRVSEQSALETYDDELQGDILGTELKPIIVNQRIEISKAFQKMDKLYFEQSPQTRNTI